MKGISYCANDPPRNATHTGQSLCEKPLVPGSKLEFSIQKSFGGEYCNSNVVRWTMWGKVMPLWWKPWEKEFYLRVNDSEFERAPLSPLLFPRIPNPIIPAHSIIEKHSRQQKGGWRIASSAMCHSSTRKFWNSNCPSSQCFWQRTEWLSFNPLSDDGIWTMFGASWLSLLAL